jgi:hypothetical protein
MEKSATAAEPWDSHSCAMFGLKELHTEIDPLAVDCKVPIAVRAEAACDQYLSNDAGRKQTGLFNLLDIAKRAEPGQWKRIARILAQMNDSGLLISVGKIEQVRQDHWALLLDEIDSEAAPKLLIELAQSDELSLDFRLAAHVRFTSDSDHIVGVLRSSKELEQIKACISSLGRDKRNVSKLFDVASGTDLPNSVRRLAIGALYQLEAR